MAAELESSYNVKVKLTEGERGIFDVTKDGKLIFSKAKTDRFPNEGEITEILASG